MEPDLFGPGKFEDDADYYEDPEGNIDWLHRKRRATRVEGNKISEKSGRLGRDYVCGCPSSAAQDGGTCRTCGRGRVCRDHRQWCSRCSSISCAKHTKWINGLPVCTTCEPDREGAEWVILLALGLAAVFLFYIVRRQS